MLSSNKFETDVDLWFEIFICVVITFLEENLKF